MKPDYWFPAKPPGHGWGWGFPQNWQGWVVYAGFWLLLVAGMVLILPHKVGLFLAYLFVLVAVLIFICSKKGEPPGGFRGPGPR